MSKVNEQQIDEIAAARAQTNYSRAVEPCGPSCGCAGPQRSVEPDFETRLKAALERVRPFLQMDGGDLELIAIEDNNALIRLVGACSSCSLSTVHMKMGVETAIKKEIPEFGELITLE